MFQKFAVNATGTDFVIGDLHGRFDLFRKFFDNMVDVCVDRVFSVGDLIDRGPDSLSCLQLLEEPWFFAVKGNHEQLMEDWMTGGPTGPWWDFNGGGWFFDLPDDKKEKVVDLLPFVEKLPWFISVGEDFHIVHAEIPNKCKELTKDSLLVTVGDGQVGIWGRDTWGSMYGQDLDDRFLAKQRRRIELQGVFKAPVPGVVFSGHTTVRKPAKILNFINIDTGAFREGPSDWAALTVADPKLGKFWKVFHDRIEETSLLTVI